MSVKEAASSLADAYPESGVTLAAVGLKLVLLASAVVTALAKPAVTRRALVGAVAEGGRGDDVIRGEEVLRGDAIIRGLATPASTTGEGGGALGLSACRRLERPLKFPLEGGGSILAARLGRGGGRLEELIVVVLSVGGCTLKAGGDGLVKAGGEGPLLKGTAVGG